MKTWSIYCDYESDITETKETFKLPGIYNERNDTKTPIAKLINQMGSHLRESGLFVVCEDIFTGELHATDSFGNYVSYCYYSRRNHNV